ncbi:MAG TPA: signal peptidase I [Pyrinomonadaceae bacterium]|nr:signal peptidase I [Pyrinomonadaceae bacterium]
MDEEVKEPKATSEKASKPVGPPKSVFREYLESFVVTLVMALFGMTFVLQAVTVPTGSMQNTILVGDYLLVNKFIFTPGGRELPFLPQRDIRRGDIIVFKYPGDQKDPMSDRARGLVKYQINYVKRVIGLPGETVEFKNNQVFINGQPLPEHRILGDQPTRGDDQSALITKDFEEREPGDKWSVYYSEEKMRYVQSGRDLPTRDYDFGVEGTEMQVPENSFFVMGDSRDQSDDSRGWGFVPRELIIGRAMFVYWSCDRGASNGSMIGCLTHPRLSRIGKFVK